MSACFSLVETSLLSARRPKLVTMANKGNRGAKAALQLLDDMVGALATILLWNNFANVVIATLATVLAVRLIADNNTVLTVTSVVTTVTILIFAEITPKAIGVRFSERVACLAGPVLLILVRLIPLGKLMGLLAGMTWFASNKSNSNANSRHIVAVSELLALIQDKDTLTEVGAEQKAMLYKMVSMHELSVRDLMLRSSDIEYVDLEDELDNILAKLYASKHHMVPMCRDGLENVVGTLSVKDVLAANRNETLTKADLEQMALAHLFVPETLDPIMALRDLISKNLHLYLVVDEYGGLVGLVTLSDYFNHIFGAVGTERTTSKNEAWPGIEIASVPGDEAVREVNLQYSLQLPEDKAKTIAGLIIEELDNFPQQKGAHVSLDGFNLVISELADHQIKTVSIRKDAPSSTNSIRRENSD